MSLNITVDIIDKKGKKISEIYVPQTTTDETLAIIKFKSTEGRLKALDELFQTKDYKTNRDSVMSTIQSAIEEFGIDHISINFI